MSEKKNIESRMKADSDIFEPSDKVWDNIKDAPIDVRTDAPKKGLSVLKYVSVAACAAIVIGGVAASVIMLNNNTPAAESSEQPALAEDSSSTALGVESQQGAETEEIPETEIAPVGTSDIYTEEIAPEYNNVAVYYLNDDGEKASETVYLELDPKVIFEEWAELNKVDEKVGAEVELVSVSIADNGWEETTESTVTYHAGDYFMLNIVVSGNIADYGDNYDELIETLKSTMSEYSDVEFDEINVLFSGVIVDAMT